MGAEVFISYSSKDHEIAGRVCGAIEAEGVTCWIASRDIPPGENWPSAIMRAIEACGVFVLVFSSHSNASDQVLREVTQAVNLRKNILPFRIESVALSNDMRYFLGVPQWLDALQHPLDPHIRNLVRAVCVLRDRTPPVAAHEPVEARAQAPVAPPNEWGRGGGRKGLISRLRSWIENGGA